MVLGMYFRTCIISCGLLTLSAAATEFQTERSGNWSLAGAGGVQTESRGGDGGSLPGAPGGRGGAAGGNGSQIADAKTLAPYCLNILETGKIPQDGSHKPLDCAQIFFQLDRRRDTNGYEALRQFCIGVLKEPDGPVKRSQRYELSDCVELFASWDSRWEGYRDGRLRGPDGPDGPSLSGGVGGSGGRGGAGPSGGAGGAGGAGAKGGRGGAGGAGGASD